MGSGSLVDEDEIQVVKIGDEGDEEDMGADEERMEETEQGEGQDEGDSEGDKDGQMLKVVVMQDECEEENGDEERTAEKEEEEAIMDTHMKETSERVEDKKDSENEGKTPTINGDVK